MYKQLDALGGPIADILRICLAKLSMIGIFNRLMITRCLTFSAILLALSLFALSCSDADIREDRARPLLNWVYPNDFEPSYVTEDESGVKWGLFASQRFSGKDNIWAVRDEGAGWVEPMLLMNAYYYQRLEFSVENDTLELVFYDMADEYFYDYGEDIDVPEFPDTTRLVFALADLRYDEDSDNLPDRLEQELLLSTSLPDSDMDGKADNVDFCPLGHPIQAADRFEIYVTALENFLDLDDPDKLLPSKDTAWTRHYGMYYLNEPNTQYLALPGENKIPEFVGLPIVVIQARSPLYFTAKPLYQTASGRVIPHLVFNRPRIGFFGSDAEMLVEYAASRHLREKAMLSFAEVDGEWSITDIEVLEE